MKTTLFSLLSVPLLAMIPSALALAGPTPVFECGTIITEPGDYVVTQDLLGCRTGGVIVEGVDINLDLGGHQITCALEGPDDFPWGVAVFVSENVHVKNGTVSGCADGMLVWASEGCKVTGITATDNLSAGIVVWEASNTLIKRNVAKDNGFSGFLAAYGSGTRMIGNVCAEQYDAHGIWYEYERDGKIALNLLRHNGAGIVLLGEGSGHVVRGNVVTHSLVTGITMTGSIVDGVIVDPIPAGNCIANNMVMGSGHTDVGEHFYDENFEFLVLPDAMCQNAWKRNWFVSEEGPSDCFGVPLYRRSPGVGALTGRLAEEEEEK